MSLRLRAGERQLGGEREADQPPAEPRHEIHRLRGGRFGGYVYWWQNGRLHWRRYVVPKDPHTPAQQRSRTAFGTTPPLLEVERHAAEMFGLDDAFSASAWPPC